MYLVISMLELNLPLIIIGLAQLIATRRYRTEDDDISCHIGQHLKRQTVFISPRAPGPYLSLLAYTRIEYIWINEDIWF